ncbi:MAG: RlmE family RNA methyltransferase [Humidesulfovibrio sp.]|uniref:RlmE family RNA methyltransferase n=1 Tax=Humidesulfovibrio sp. TaxID=2910988 RepID=UPI0027358228|nr:RlmE family RNA methyltransferase [Humidesulfovibrio sp.]MDP2847228.1 RlmE family RNA methyltransferase [Humidesulfovibrio sp.]
MKEYRDHYFKRAKAENYPARSVYKLQELDAKFSLLKQGLKVLDLGAAPGSWTLFAAKKVGPAGFVLALDIQTTEQEFPDNVQFLVHDAFEDTPELLALMEPHLPFDFVMSDMAPRTTGIKFTDQARSVELCERARDVALRRLKPGGNFVAKIFEGPDAKGFQESLRPYFEKVRGFKPKSSRAESKETFILGLGFRGEVL